MNNLEMKKLVSQVFLKLSRIIYLFSRFFYVSEQEKRVIPWFKDQGDKNLRLNYCLNEKSVVFDLGGYEGQWASDIFSMYCCSIYIFEPIPEFEVYIKLRFKKNKKIMSFQFGLAHESYKSKISQLQDGSSIYKSSKSNISIQLIDFKDFCENHKIKQIDLIKINIEGGEYDLLDYLINDGLVKNIKNIQIQFHDFVPDAEQRMLNIQEQLSATHKLTYQYIFVWENWELINTKSVNE